MHPSDKADGPLTPGLVFEMLQAHQRTAALKAAIDLDLFRAVGDGPGDVASIARHCGASERGTRILCDFLVINGVLVKDERRYRHSATSAAVPRPAVPGVPGLDRAVSGQPGHAGAVRPPGRGRPVRADRAAGRRQRRTREPDLGAVRGNHGAHDGADGRPAWRGGPARPRRPDARAGHRRRPRAVRHRDREAESRGPGDAASTGRPSCAWRSTTPGGPGFTSRYDMLPGSAFEVDFGGPYDVVLLTNFLHHFDQRACIGLLQKVHRGARARRTRRHAGIRAERGPRVAADAGRVRDDHADVDGRRRRLHAERADVDVPSRPDSAA